MTNAKTAAALLGSHALGRTKKGKVASGVALWPVRERLDRQRLTAMVFEEVFRSSTPPEPWDRDEEVPEG